MNGAFIVNEEGTIELTLWDEWIFTIKNHILENENKFKNLFVKEFNNTVHLSSCSDTSYELIDDNFEMAAFSKDPK